MPRRCPVFSDIKLCHVIKCPGIAGCPTVKMYIKKLNKQWNKEGEANAKG